MSNKDDIILWLLLATGGGGARFLADRMSTDALPISGGRFFFLLGANIFVSGFSGIMGALMMSAITPEQVWISASAGIFGFMGPKGLEVLSEKLSNKL